MSAISEIFLKKLSNASLIYYNEGSDEVYTADDLPDDIKMNVSLQPIDEKNKQRLNKVMDLILFRYGTTGVQDVLARAVESLGVIPCFPVTSIISFSSGGESKGVFKDCILVSPGTTVRQFAKMVSPEIDKKYQYAEGVSGMRLGENDIITLENNIISFKTSGV